MLRHALALVLDADRALVARFRNDLEERWIVEQRLVALLVEVVTLGGHPLRVRRDERDVAHRVNQLARAVAPVAEVGQRAAAASIGDKLHDIDNPRAIRRKTAVIFNDDVEFVRLRHLEEFDETVCATNRLLASVSLADRIHADCMTSNLLREREPLLVIRRELCARCFVGRTAQSFAVAHDEFALHAEVVAALTELAAE